MDTNNEKLLKSSLVSSAAEFYPTDVKQIGKLGFNFPINVEDIPTLCDKGYMPQTGALWLHVRWRSNCYVAYAEYYFEAWVTSTADSGGPRVPVNQLELRWRHGGTRGHESRDGVDMIAKDDRVYAYGIACESDLCVIGTAHFNGASWSAVTPGGCVA